jgi:GDP-4-dehydro-6-deoxy-D-mannose reductase
MDKYLITGFSGFVGKHFLDLLEQCGNAAEVLGIDLYPPKFGYKDRHNIQCEFMILDLLERKAIQGVLSKFKPDYLLHLASYSSVSFSWKKPILSFQSNTNIFLNILEAVQLNNLPTRILSVGSSEVYGDIEPNDIPITEEHSLNPKSPYAVARASQEMFAKIYSEGFGLDIILTRSFNHIGPGQSEIFAVPSFAKQIVEGHLRGEKSITLRAGDLNITRDFLDVRDVVKAYYVLLKQGRKGEIYNICSGRGVSLMEILALMERTIDVRCVISKDPKLLRPVDNAIIIGSNAKLKKETGWNPEISLEQSINDILMDGKFKQNK